MTLEVAVRSNQPPGKRCKLYMAYAAELGESLGFEVSILFPNWGEQPAPPALIVGGTVVQPSDGVTVSPDDVVRTVERFAPALNVRELRARLERVRQSAAHTP